MKIVLGRINTLAVFALICLGILLIAHDTVWVDAAVLIGIQGLIALSVGLCYGQGGLLSLAQAPFAAIGAYTTAIITLKFGWSPALGLLLAILLPSIIAFIFAKLIIGLDHLPVALATLAFGAIVEIVIRNWEDVTGGYVGLAGIPPLPSLETPLSYLILVWGTVVATVLLYENLMSSPYGRALHTIRHDRARALADGVPVASVLSNMFAVSAAISGVAGWLYAHYLSFIGPGDLGTSLSISVLLMAVVGGAAEICGPLVGAIILTILARILPGQEFQNFFYGASLIVVLVVARQGVLGLILPFLRGLLFRRKPTASVLDLARQGAIERKPVQGSSVT